MILIFVNREELKISQIVTLRFQYSVDLFENFASSVHITQNTDILEHVLFILIYNHGFYDFHFIWQNDFEIPKQNQNWMRHMDFCRNTKKHSLYLH